MNEVSEFAGYFALGMLRAYVQWVAAAVVFVAVFEWIVTVYWVWLSLVIAFICAAATYEAMGLYCERRVRPCAEWLGRGTKHLAVGTWALGHSAVQSLAQSVRGLRAREEHTHV